MDLKKISVKALTDSHSSRNLRQRAEGIVAELLAEEAKGIIEPSEERRVLTKEIVDEALGLGPLEDLLKNEEITEIMVNGKDNVYIEKFGKIELTGKKFSSNEQVRAIIERILAPLGKRIDESTPTVDARLLDGSRVNAVIPPLSLIGPTLTIRKFAKERYTMEDLIDRFGSLTQDMADFLRACVVTRKNIIISGGTGSGKTTFLNILSEYILPG